MFRLEAFVLLSGVQRSGEEAWGSQPSHLFKGRSVVVSFGTHIDRNLISSAERRKT